MDKNMARPKKNPSPVLTEINKDLVVEKQEKKRAPRKKKEDVKENIVPKPVEKIVSEPVNTLQQPEKTLLQLESVTEEVKKFDNTVFSNEILIEEKISKIQKIISETERTYEENKSAL